MNGSMVEALHRIVRTCTIHALCRVGLLPSIPAHRFRLPFACVVSRTNFCQYPIFGNTTERCSLNLLLESGA
jgi:hypothetical protein